ncbi:Crp/Fnr family transcriptional regulator [Actinophytocola xanthii]|nr:Crp/Fnr family transcriptional regulator [Actinophytocola xanthii]
MNVEWPLTSMLARLAGPARRALLELGNQVTLRTGERVLREGEDGDAVYVLLAGVVKVSAVGGDRESLLAIRAAGDLVGEMSVLLRRPRSATVVPCVETTARVLSGTAFRTYLHNHPAAAIELAGMLGERLRWANDRRVDVAALDARARVRRVLVALVESFGRPVSRGWDLGVRLTQEDIASLAGVRLNTAEKALRELSRGSLVGLGYRHVVVHDLDGLRDPIGTSEIRTGNGSIGRARGKLDGTPRPAEEDARP